MYVPPSSLNLGMHLAEDALRAFLGESEGKRPLGLVRVATAGSLAEPRNLSPMILAPPPAQAVCRRGGTWMDSPEARGVTAFSHWLGGAGKAPERCLAGIPPPEGQWLRGPVRRVAGATPPGNTRDMEMKGARVVPSV